MMPLTKDKPKALVEIAGKPIIDYTFDALPDEITEVILVIGTFGEQIRKHVGSFYKGKKVRYVEQSVIDGPYTALAEARDVLTCRFLVLMGDDLYSKDSLQKMMDKERAMGVYFKENVDRPLGTIIIKSEKIVDLVLEDTIGNSVYLCTGAYVLGLDFFDQDIIRGGPKNETLLSCMVVTYAKERGMAAVEFDYWVPVASPHDILMVESTL